MTTSLKAQTHLCQFYAFFFMKKSQIGGMKESHVDQVADTWIRGNKESQTMEAGT